ncbi:hypothetical protein [Acuticoccus sediminis]|uniref:hypothetical protein n=1 Tax=Acuticoccus sediminis TaxID=2184697 RepID=UPI001CFE8300|nr:hypothetical protein [Acuticoccus sediminis]
MDALFEIPSFDVIGADGLGRQSATTAHAMAVFKGQLYLATGSAVARNARQAPRIMRYDAAGQRWVEVYGSPMVAACARAAVPDRQLAAARGGTLSAPGRNAGSGLGSEVPRDTGYASMVVFQGASDPEPALYVSTMSRGGALILRSTDGATFEPVGEPGFGSPEIFSFRTLTAYKGSLYAVPAGTVTDEYLDRFVAPAADVYVTDDPAGGVWRKAAEPGFGDPLNLSVNTLCAANGRLYAGTHNPALGFQVWTTEATGEAPFTWTRVIDEGASRFQRNLVVTAMAEFDGALYVGGGVNGPGTDPVHDIGPAACELIRVWPDGRWDLVVGEPRFSPQGLKVPAAMMGPGFDDFFNAAIVSLCVHEGALYLGTHQWEAFQAIENGAGEVVGGAQLWRSVDGETWEIVLEDGNGNPADVAYPALASTPFGLAVGTQNQSLLLRLAGRDRKDTTFPAGLSVLIGV